MILDDLGIPYQIIEAQDHVGGRLFTHTFTDSTGAPYNYYDVGAMRFPKTNAMNRVLDLFNSKKVSLTLQDYIFSCPQELKSYNGITVQKGSIKDGVDTFDSKAVIEDTTPDPYITYGVDKLVGDVIGPFVQALQDDLTNDTKNGWEYMEQFAAYSTRAYMSTKYIPSQDLITNYGLPATPLSNDIVNWCETFDKATGWYDRALSETVLESIAFGTVNTQWHCVK